MCRVYCQKIQNNLVYQSHQKKLILLKPRDSNWNRSVLGNACSVHATVRGFHILDSRIQVKPQPLDFRLPSQFSLLFIHFSMMDCSSNFVTVQNFFEKRVFLSKCRFRILRLWDSGFLIILDSGIQQWNFPGFHFPDYDLHGANLIVLSSPICEQTDT